jgi:hypothetical protein
MTQLLGVANPATHACCKCELTTKYRNVPPSNIKMHFAWEVTGGTVLWCKVGVGLPENAVQVSCTNINYPVRLTHF